jgi:RimJ/RimL family protein N-acetyltransferase
MALIAIAHPKFRPCLIQEAKKLNLIYKDQLFIPGGRGLYPKGLETYRTTKNGLEILLRPVRMSDEPLLKDFFYSLSDESLYRRFLSVRQDMPHERLQEFVIIDYTEEMAILAVREQREREQVIGLGQYFIDESTHTADVAVVVRDDYQNRGVGTELLTYLTHLGKRQGLLGCTAQVLMENRPMLHLLENAGFDIEKKRYGGVCELKLAFKGGEVS